MTETVKEGVAVEPAACDPSATTCTPISKGVEAPGAATDMPESQATAAPAPYLHVAAEGVTPPFAAYDPVETVTVVEVDPATEILPAVGVP